ncbi:hypothetical protein NIES2107_07410 [Nostoc carneum NIES-2107]|nr:hypothetical protein [Calothrix membranacea FACHB-236]BAY28904.1 hypothetical protein NIES2107_07410 [Nostoc carneum NIES-2107]
MSLSINQHIYSKVKFVWTTLVALILSTMLFAPAPALALNYGETLQSYISSVKPEFDSIQKSITELPNLSYENSKKTIPEIENKLQQLKSDANKRAKEFKQLSDQAQVEYENRLDEINSLYIAQQNQQQEVQKAEQEVVRAETRFRTNLAPAIFIRDAFGQSCTQLVAMTTALGAPSIASGHPVCIVVNQHNQIIESSPERQEVLRAQEVVQRSKNLLITYQQKQNDLQKTNQILANDITLGSQASLFFNKIEQKINLAKNKTGKFKEFLAEFSSFNEPDLLNEKNALSNSIAQVMNTVQLLQ